MDGSKKIRFFEDFFNTLKCSKCSTGGHLSEFERASSVGSLGLFSHWVGIIALELLWSVAEVLLAEEKAFPAVHASEALVCQ